MNLDANDPLDQALRSRRAMEPPPAFTQAVMARVHFASIPDHSPTFLSEHGVRAGLTIAAVGLSLVVRPDRLTDAIDAVCRAPGAPLAVAIVAICVGWVLTREEPEAEAL